MSSYTVFTVIGIILILGQIVTAQFREPQQYAATQIPRDPKIVRNVLGYNKYDDGRNVQSSNQNVAYGNNWEQFDDRVQNVQPAALYYNKPY